jgi:hypothetical protein
MNIEDIRKQSIEQFAALRRKALFEAQQNSPITMAPAAAAGASGGGSSNVEPEPVELAFKLMFTDISFANGLVGDATSVEDWNTYLDLPINGVPFTSVIVTGNEVALYGGAGVTLKTSAFEVYGKEDPSYLISVNDESGVITELQNRVFVEQKLLTTVSLPQVVTIGIYSCNSCFILTTILLPSCTNLGGTVLNNEVFNFIAGNTIGLTVPAALMTCNSGNPDGDIQYLQENNTVTIITI